MSREWIAQFSIPRAKARLARIKAEAEMPEKTRMAAQQEVQKRVKNLDVVASQIADTRPVSFCQFSPDSQMLATASWSGVCKVIIIIIIILMDKYLDVINHPDTCSAFRPFYSVSVSLLSLRTPA